MIKHYWIYKLLLLLLCTACKKEEIVRYEREDSIYFNFDKDNIADTAKRHVTYSFAYDLSRVSDTLLLPVRISGNTVDYDRHFKVSLDTGTTAQEGVHYQGLQAHYVLAAGTGQKLVPLVLFNADPTLSDRTVTIRLKLEETSDFQLNLPQAITAKISLSSRLEQPSWWVFWQSSLGGYSRVKHQLFLISSGTIDMPNPVTEGGLIPKALYHIERYRTFLINPLRWVEQNPERGYVLRAREGTRDYDFFYEEIPDRTFLLQYDAQVNAYIFVDENGENIY